MVYSSLPGGIQELRKVNIGNASLAVLAVGVEVGLAVVHVEEVIQLLRDHGAAVLVAHLRRRTLHNVTDVYVERRAW